MLRSNETNIARLAILLNRCSLLPQLRDGLGIRCEDPQWRQGSNDERNKNRSVTPRETTLEQVFHNVNSGKN